MKAIGARQFLSVSDPGCLIEFEINTPIPKSTDLLVRVKAIAVNPVDTKIRASLGSEPLDPPRILGWDAAGIVEAVGDEVTGFEIGDEVFYAGDVTRPGCNAEFQAVDFRLVALKPKSWNFAEAAALPLVTLTAWELLFERMGICPDGKDSGKSLLIINGAGGVGSAMIPLARRAGLMVVATASRQETSAWCKLLGARHVINHREPLRPQSEALGIAAFPYIANLYNTEAYWETTADLIAPLGTLGLIVEPREKLHLGDPLKAKCVRIAWEFMAARSKFQTPDMHRQGEILQEIATLCDAGSFPKLHTQVFDSFNVANLREAHAAMESGTAHGKWVMKLAD
ncbi:MAG: zinc-binding alcohol dehydrogenase family protein [Gloeobacteraceae cyanobacterium ES-bin-144]|nr:zinc-binding alcohol dehydrogenase family protein [Verrucomicrobiales bacterium]